MREIFRSFLRRIGLLSFMRRIRNQATLLSHPDQRRKNAQRRAEFSQFSRSYGAALGISLSEKSSNRRVALIAGLGFEAGVRVELGLIKALELAGFESVALNRDDPWLFHYYKLAGVRRILCWDDVIPPVRTKEAKRAMRQVHGFEDLLAFEWQGTRVGRFAASSLLRQLRVGAIDFQSADMRKRITSALAIGIAHAAAAEGILNRVRPDLAIFVDRGYTPHGELFDRCIRTGVDTLAWYAAHKSNALLLKRYHLGNQDEHPASLSADSWQAILKMPWTESFRQELLNEWAGTYASGEWCSEVGTQFNKRLFEPEELKRRLKLDPNKKTAVIFPHILWDGTFFWGTDLFESYESWLVEAVAAACANPQVNWVIKIHPANLVKNSREGLHTEPGELIAIRRLVEKLPPHVVVVPPQEDISTYSLFSIMDFCLTVRGTVGVEAASLGIPVLTAGTGRFDHKGFTIDSSTREEYLNRLSHIQDIPPLTSSQRELAERFAYGTFILRPFLLKTVTMEFERDANASMRTQVFARTREDWQKAQDLNAFARWTQNRQQEDFLQREPTNGDATHEYRIAESMTGAGHGN
ncbi:MAG: hypothetical protein HYT88_04765 [Candidatus Omnitrophica bacterium]|nr:hypothetical protein [Candidatus Omnitrophota bacterium]